MLRAKTQCTELEEDRSCSWSTSSSRSLAKTGPMAAQGDSRKRLLAKHRANIVMSLHVIQGYPLLEGFLKVLIIHYMHDCTLFACTLHLLRCLPNLAMS